MRIKPSLVSENNKKREFLDFPKFERYIDLNVGNGDLLLSINPKTPCFINDTNNILIDFYKNLSNQELLNELDKLANAWNLLKDFSYFSSDEIFITFQDLLKEIITLEDSEYIIRAITLMNMDNDKFNSLFNRSVLVNLDLFTSSIIKSIISEFKKIKLAFAHIENVVINEEFRKMIETAFKYGFFNHFQNILNLQNTEFINIIDQNKCFSLWYFLSQTCKGRFNYVVKESHNNKYGGEENNNLDLSEIVKKFKSEAFNAILSTCNFSSCSYSELLDSLSPVETDFICGDFRSSNYFSASSKDVFVKNDLEKAIEKLIQSKSKWLLIFSSSKYIDLMRNNASINIECTEHKEKTFFTAKNY
ncbi:MAG: hypothetical protein JEZ09_01185 [Salinivirgaceae bacterium]|nr:hypothetical protein [Salinivirgaceae bacterium]